MEKTKVVKELAHVFTDAERVEIVAEINANLNDYARGVEFWDKQCVRYTVDSKIDLPRKREISALYKAQCEARGLADGVAKMQFSRGTAAAEVRAGLREVPKPGPNAGKKGTKKAKEAPTGDAAANDGVSAAFTLEIAAIAREVADRVAHFQTHEKLTKSATEAIGKIAELIGAMNVKLGNVPTVA